MPFWAKLLLIVLAVFAVVIIAAVIFINSKLDLVKYDTPDTTFTPISSTESKEADEEEGDIVDISGLEERAPSELPAGEILSSDAVDLVVKSIEATTRTIREVHDAVDSADPSTADLLHELINKLEQQAWFIAAEKRQPQD